MQAGSSEAKKKALIQSWLSKEAVPIDQAVFSGGGGGSGNILVRIFMFFATRPAYVFGLLFFLKKFLRYLDNLGQEEIEGEKDL